MRRILVAEPSAPISAALRRFLDGTAEVQVVHFVDEAVQAVRARTPDVLIASVSGSFDGETLGLRVKKFAPGCGVVLVYPPEEETAAARAADHGADSFLVGPLKKAGVLAAVRAVVNLMALKARVVQLEGEVATLKAAVKPAPPKPATATGINTVDEAFFKKYLLLEVKRSKRYQYPVALLLVELDRFAEHLAREASPEFQRAAIRAEVMAGIGSLVRDIDLAMPFAEDKYLVFLPHTPRAGALVVASRMVERLRKLDHFGGGTASIGLASFEPKVDPKAKVSFGALVREASAALLQAQKQGGNRVEASQAPEAAPKRSRISMG